MKKLDYNKLLSLQHLWCDDYDRWLYIAKVDGMEYAKQEAKNDIYYNHCQSSDYKYFVEFFNKPDYGLSEFLSVEVQDHNNIKEVNEMIWVYFNAIDCYENQKGEL